jgi:hypothetical protein
VVQSKLERVVLGPDHTAEPPVRNPGVAEGIVKSVDPATGVMFIVPDFDDGVYAFGPAPYPLADPAPAAGDRCLVVWVGQGVDNPWIIGSWPS